MNTERGLFLYELEGRGFIFKNKTWIHGIGDVGGLFDDDEIIEMSSNTRNAFIYKAMVGVSE